MITRRPGALRSLVAHASFIAADSPAAAERFLGAAERAFSSLARSPRMARAWGSRRGRLRGIRVWPVPGFPNHLIFFREVASGIEILDVIHGARHIEDLGGEE